MNNSDCNRIIIVVLTFLLGACGETGTSDNTPGADLVFTNGRVYTLDTDRPWAEAVAVSDGRISFVGSSAGAEQYIGSDTTVVDLNRRMMLPAFQDSHIHPIYAGMEASACDLNGQNGIAGYRSVISEYAAANPNVPWILGGGWSMSVFGPGGSPSRSIIDELVADRPVFLTSADGHTGWANSQIGRAHV